MPFPLGTIVAFAGNLTNDTVKSKLASDGWLVCDGSSLSAQNYPDLIAAIEYTNGGSGANFNLPQLSDRYIRGLAEASTSDPDSNSRIAAAPGGNSGNAVGSLQLGATAVPVTPWAVSVDPDHSHNYSHLDNDSHQAWGGSTYHEGRWPGSGTTDGAGSHTHTVAGGDSATVPVSLSLYSIVKAKNSTSEGTTPVGAVVALNSTPSGWQGWADCNGAAQAVTASNQALASVIGFNFGGDGQTVFDLPDLRGRFIRGTSHSTKRDPDAATRLASQTGGSTGDNVGSLQSWATTNGRTSFTLAKAGQHSHTLQLGPVDYHNIALGASGPAAYNVQVWDGSSNNYGTSSSGSHTHTIQGGDHETRPENIYMNWQLAVADYDDAPPIGSVVPFVGDVTDIANMTDLVSAGWLPCIGGSLPRSGSAYSALYGIIGDTFGGTSLSFSLPDLRGYFIIGAGKNALGATITKSTTGSPVMPFTTSNPGSHTHTVGGGIPTTSQRIDVVMGKETAEYNDGSSSSDLQDDHTHTITGGDNESRPVNVNMDFIIRYR